MTKFLWLQLGITACLSLGIVAANADSWSFHSAEREFKLSRGLRVLVVTDARKSTQYPKFSLKIYDGKRLVANYPDFWFEYVAEAPDGETFVGLSNRGIPGTAAAVFTRRGGLRLLAIHGLARFDYCDESVSWVKRWYDEKNPNVRFDGPTEKGGITLRDCRGQQVPLFEVVARAYNNALQ